ncbi:hypothetical protein TSAR_008706 [Trichomalopsis sarcophagae]|uniref:RRM domain-containing protein n=1 Tax=Trichomalopsis sarcophagae TaxID=543379 RepID=A0A232EF68_9HYME|nr:hypothetical protein TSAR_008706 [Trichomalopsis sarcophagae]
MTLEKKKVGNFNTIWIRYDVNSSDRHQLFIKAHSIRNQEPEYPRGKTLFVLNIPPYATVESVQNAFSVCGQVKSVSFAKSSSGSDSGFKTGYIVFAKDAGLDKALSLQSEHTLVLSTKDATVLTGIKKWCKDYNDSIQDEKEIKKNIEDYMNAYDQKVAARLEAEKAAEEAKDDDGWTTVTGRKKRGQFALARKESTIQKVQVKEEMKKQKKQLMNFYTFQIREAKKQNLADLRKKFELDKKKLEQIKSKRKFKPF